MAKNEFGDWEPLTLRWAIARPVEADRKELTEQAREEQRRIDDEALRAEIIDAVTAAWEAGNPINRAGVRAAVRRRGADVADAIERLLSEQWVHEIFVDSRERINPNRKAFLVALDETEHAALLAGGALPEAKMTVPDSWKKAVPFVPKTRERTA